MKSICQPMLLVIPVLLSYSLGENAFSHDSSGAQQVSVSTQGNTPHPPGLPSIWKGKNVTELVAGLGEPDAVLETAAMRIAVYGDTHSVMYVYADPGGQAYDAYVVEHDSGEILAYHRR